MTWHIYILVLRGYMLTYMIFIKHLKIIQKNKKKKNMAKC